MDTSRIKFQVGMDVLEKTGTELISDWFTMLQATTREPGDKLSWLSQLMDQAEAFFKLYRSSATVLSHIFAERFLRQDQMIITLIINIICSE